MNDRFGLVLLAFSLAFLSLRAAAVEQADREKKINETSAWLTNDFVPWLTNAFPDATTKPYPEWFVNSFSRTRLPTWLTNTFPQIDTEEFPHWLNNPAEDSLAA